jgi:4-hydroxy-tetrahydrodipicolinate synthase
MAPPIPRIITAVPVAFHDDGSLDLPASEAILEFVAGAGVGGAFLTGTTGEFPALERGERDDLTRVGLRAFDGLERIVHAGAASAAQTGALLDDARAAGATRVAVITPYYLAASRDDVLRYFAQAAARAEGLDLYLYLFRQRTGVTVEPELLAELATLPGVRGAKISGESAERIAEYTAAVPDGFDVLTGQDALVGRIVELGGAGVVSGVSSCLPELFIAVRDAIAAGDADALARAQGAVDEAVAAIDGDIARVKTVLEIRGVIPAAASACRMAVGAPDARTRARLEELVAAHV